MQDIELNSHEEVETKQDVFSILSKIAVLAIANSELQFSMAAEENEM